MSILMVENLIILQKHPIHHIQNVHIGIEQKTIVIIALIGLTLKQSTKRENYIITQLPTREVVVESCKKYGLHCFQQSF